MLLILIPILLEVQQSRATAFDIVDSSQKEIEVLWTTKVLTNGYYYTNEILYSPRTILTKEVCYDDGYPVIHPTAMSKRLEEQHLDRSLIPEVEKQSTFHLSDALLNSNPLHRTKSTNNQLPQGGQIKLERAVAKAMTKKEGVERKGISAEEAGLRKRLFQNLNILRALEIESKENLNTMEKERKQCERDESRFWKDIQGDWEIDTHLLRDQMKRERRSIRKEDRKDTMDVRRTSRTPKGDAPKCTVKVFCPTNQHPDGMEKLIGFLTEEQKQGRCDHLIIRYINGPDLLMITLRRYYNTLKAYRWQQQDALDFMAELTTVFAMSSPEVTAIWSAASQEMGIKYEDNKSTQMAMDYFHWACKNDEFDGRVFATLFDKFDEENQMIPVAIDYFVHLFDTVITRKVDDLRSIFKDDAPIWDGMMPTKVLQDEQKRIDEIVVALKKDVRSSADLQKKTQRIMDKDLVAERLSDQTNDVINAERFAVLKLLFDELRFGMIDLTIFRKIREWIKSRDGSAGTICVAVDQIDRHTLETVILYHEKVNVEKWKATELRMPPARKGNVRTQSKWRLEGVKSLDIQKVTVDGPVVPFDVASGEKSTKKKRRGRNKLH